MVQAHQDQWLNREFEDDDPHVWHRNNSAALGYANALHELVFDLENLGWRTRNIQEEVANDEE